MERKKPKFLRKDWHKEIKLGRTVKKLRKWRAAKGRHNKIRLSRRGQSRRPKIGWSLGGSRKGVGGKYVLNLKDLSSVKKGEGILIGAVGGKKRKEIVAKANDMAVKILNKYKVVKK
ncbi:MAG: eL32 family ribosomal protein [archaeon]